MYFPLSTRSVFSDQLPISSCSILFSFSKNPNRFSLTKFSQFFLNSLSYN
jgi:hypothetical protein